MKYEGTNYEMLNMVYFSTTYVEMSTVKSRNAQFLKLKLDEIWMCRHGAPANFIAVLQTSTLNFGPHFFPALI